MNNLPNLMALVDEGNQYFASIVESLKQKGFKREQYVRYLQMQYHLTKGVQNTFLAIAAHPETRKYRKLRPFLVNFAYEEEMHYKLAEADLAQLGETPGDIPFVVELWWEYQKSVVKNKPLERLGATAILENIGNHSAGNIKEMMAAADYLTKKNTTFVQVHMHEELPHGDQILEALDREKFTPEHQAQLEEGARRGIWLYASTIFDWIQRGELTLAKA